MIGAIHILHKISLISDIIFVYFTNRGVIFLRSEAQKKADQKYRNSDKNQYKTISCGLRREQAQDIENYAKNQGLTISKFLLQSAIYCMDNKINFE